MPNARQNGLSVPVRLPHRLEQAPTAPYRPTGWSPTGWSPTCAVRLTKSSTWCKLGPLDHRPPCIIESSLTVLRGERMRRHVERAARERIPTSMQVSRPMSRARREARANRCAAPTHRTVTGPSCAITPSGATTYTYDQDDR